MFRWDLGLTTKLAFAMSTVLILFLSSAFISLAHANTVVIPPGMPDGMPGTTAGNEEEVKVDYSFARFRDMWNDMKAGQESYVERWAQRKSKYRMYEDYAQWLRDHGYFDDDGGTEPQWGPSPWYAPGPGLVGPWTLPTIIDVLLEIF